MRSPSGRVGPLQFPPSLSERSEPLTPEGSSRLHLQGLHRFHGLHPEHPGSAPSCPTHRTGDLTTRQASPHATDRTVASPFTGPSTLASDPARYQTKPPAC